MNRLKQTLIGAAALLATATVALIALVPSQGDATVFAPPQRVKSEAIAAEGKVGFRCFCVSPVLFLIVSQEVV